LIDQKFTSGILCEGYFCQRSGNCFFIKYYFNGSFGGVFDFKKVFRFKGGRGDNFSGFFIIIRVWFAGSRVFGPDKMPNNFFSAVIVFISEYDCPLGVSS